ncbi:30S ribosomal protein S17 [Buchnera aphidicola]|uniref:Small ribosomal subunit protein uS17 n=2 Tax=Buchnera aphidicola (Cinara cedri) TaxID=261318 RepID=RS17_BUCCC|nr:30S ribosomal protein S17 [Buchnera aphidicola]Q057B3.1 RecName: Full=Small ribosomal subunit protein uS17; AltName: Full=30S ribosomal protein S17 [Buchnera aphidicola BCc]AAW72698.1 30S ribosomal protein S17 [Buchnera aphidicola (Cinara cedri)]ABJ90786.1 30S ribosomal protein S17 [Buchnera aphidicola BCc]
MNEKKNLLNGYIVSNKMNKSAVVIVERKIKHSIYKKFIKKRTKLCIHDEKNICNIGDIVTIRECRPISKTKSWILVNILEKSIV